METEPRITQSVPLVRGDDGVFRIAGSRVTLDRIVHEFKSGATAEQIQEDFPSLTLSDLYSTIAYYFQHRRAVEDYLIEQRRASEELRSDVERNLATAELRDRLRQRRSKAAR